MLKRGYRKNIACLESLWSKDIENRLTVVPILDLLMKRTGTKSVLLTCNTLEELAFNLEFIKGMRGYGILYLAFHGYPGGIHLPKMAINLEILAKLMRKRFRNWIVFFGSCQTLSVRKDRIARFMSSTGVKMVIGYKMEVDWLDSSALDLLVLDWLQLYKNMPKFWARFRKIYKDLVRITGLRAFHK